MPIAHAVSRVLFEGCAPRDAIAELMGRELRPERDR
jgi:glycerol-3-phosphate dehydrogenase